MLFFFFLPQKPFYLGKKISERREISVTFTSLGTLMKTIESALRHLMQGSSFFSAIYLSVSPCRFHPSLSLEIFTLAFKLFEFRKKRAYHFMSNLG